MLLKSLLAGVSALSLFAAVPALADIALTHIGSISAADSPTGKPMLAAAHEVSGTTALYAIGVK